MYCGQCGAKLNGQAGFCHACGATRGAFPATRQSSRRPLYWGLGILLAGLLVVIIGAVMAANGAFAPPTPPPIADRERALVTSYYSDISSHDLQAAYNRLSPAAKRSQEFNSWVDAYGSIETASVSNVAVSNDSVSFRLRQQNKTDSGTLTTISNGSWHITNAGGLRLNTEHLALLYDSYFLDKPSKTEPISSIYQKIKPSLAFVLTRTSDNDVGSGTAFCIGSDETNSYYLTSLHVVPDGSVSWILPMNGKATDVATVNVLFRDVDHDAAIIQAQIPAVPILKLQAGLPTEGQNIAIAGFPFMQVEIAALSDMGLKGLTPSLHLGTINALVPDGSMIEFDATTDHGNSGGPLFNPETGVVYGIVTAIAPGESQAVQGSFATSLKVLWPFIERSKVRVLSTDAPPE